MLHFFPVKFVFLKNKKNQDLLGWAGRKYALFDLKNRMNLHTGLKINIQVKFCDFVEASQDVYISQTKTKSTFSVSFQISVEECIIRRLSIGKNAFRTLHKYPWKKESFQRHWGHDIMARKVEIMNIKYFSFMKEDYKVDSRNRKIP